MLSKTLTAWKIPCIAKVSKQHVQNCTYEYSTDPVNIHTYKNVYINGSNLWKL